MGVLHNDEGLDSPERVNSPGCMYFRYIMRICEANVDKTATQNTQIHY